MYLESMYAISASCQLSCSSSFNLVFEEKSDLEAVMRNMTETVHGGARRGRGK